MLRTLYVKENGFYFKLKYRSGSKAFTGKNNLLVIFLKAETRNGNGSKFSTQLGFNIQALVVPRVDNAIQRISIGKTNYTIRWIVLSTL